MMGMSFIGLGIIWLTLVNGIPVIQQGKSSQNSGIPDADGICRESGFRRNSTDPTCMQFYRCVDFSGNGRFVIFQFTCGPTTVFDETLSVCIRPANSAGCQAIAQLPTASDPPMDVTTETVEPTEPAPTEPSVTEQPTTVVPSSTEPVPTTATPDSFICFDFWCNWLIWMTPTPPFPDLVPAKPEPAEPTTEPPTEPPTEPATTEAATTEAATTEAATTEAATTEAATTEPAPPSLNVPILSLITNYCKNAQDPWCFWLSVFANGTFAA